MKKFLLVASITLFAGFLAWNYLALPVSRDWTAQEIALIQSLSLSHLPLPPADPGNRFADDPQAAELGQRLFFDSRLSRNGSVSCASCHQPERMFTDGIPLAIGLDVGTRNTPSLVGLAYSPWLYWDGRKDSQWAQALAPIEAAHEHGLSRVSVAHLLAGDALYRNLYENLFGPMLETHELPASATPLGTAEEQAAWLQLSPATQADVSRVFSNVGKALAAYQRLLLPGPSRFDAYADSLSGASAQAPSSVLNGTEIAGLRLFLDKAQCVNCHNGPLFTNNEFHNTGILSAAGQLPSMGRFDGIRQARQDEFNCLGPFSDAAPEECVELRFARDSNDLVGAHKTPTLRNVTLTAPYMHSGQQATLAEVLDHYNEAPVSMLSHNEAKPLGLRNVELRQLEAFLHTLTAQLATPTRWLRAPGN